MTVLTAPRPPVFRVRNSARYHYHLRFYEAACTLTSGQGLRTGEDPTECELRYAGVIGKERAGSSHKCDLIETLAIAGPIIRVLSDSQPSKCPTDGLTFAIDPNDCNQRPYNNTV